MRLTTEWTTERTRWVQTWGFVRPPAARLGSGDAVLRRTQADARATLGGVGKLFGQAGVDDRAGRL